MNYIIFDWIELDLEEFFGIVDVIFFKESDCFLYELLWLDSFIWVCLDGEECVLVEVYYCLFVFLFNFVFILIVAVVYLVGDYFCFGYGKCIVIVVGVGLILWLVGFSV